MRFFHPKRSEKIPNSLLQLLSKELRDLVKTFVDPEDSYLATGIMVAFGREFGSL